MMDVVLDKQQRLSELVEHHQKLYANSSIEDRLRVIVEESPCSSLSQRDVVRIFKDSKAVVFDTHVAVVSGHHTATYLGFESIARFPHLISLISGDMGQWVLGLGQHYRIDGLLVPASDARLLAEGIATVLKSRMPVRVVYAPFDAGTGKIGTDVSEDAIRKGDTFVVVNDVTTRGNCVNKLGTIVNDRGGHVAGMMVFARRDSGQFPFIDDLMSRYPFYYGTKLAMPQWEVQACPNCQRGEEFFSWREMPV
jgi:orotate phosphoribosyltransferase